MIKHPVEVRLKAISISCQTNNHNCSNTYSYGAEAAFPCVCVHTNACVAKRHNSLWRISQNSPACWWHSTPLEAAVLFQSAGKKEKHWTWKDTSADDLNISYKWTHKAVKKYSITTFHFHQDRGFTDVIYLKQKHLDLRFKANEPCTV